MFAPGLLEVLAERTGLQIQVDHDYTATDWHIVLLIIFYQLQVHIIMKKLLVLLLLPLLVSCRARLNGKNEMEFSRSLEKVEKMLNETERMNLDKALRVVTLEAMRRKWEEPERYKGKSFDRITLDLVDGLTYTAVVTLAEDIMKRRNKKEMDLAAQEIDSLYQLKSDVEKIKQQLSVFRISSVTLGQAECFGEMVPQLEVNFQYIGKAPLKGAQTVAYEVRKKSTNKAINTLRATFGSSESVLEPGESRKEQILLNQPRSGNPRLWQAPRYPVANPNLANYDLELTVEVQALTINGKTVTLPKTDLAQIEVRIKSFKEKLEDLKTMKGALRELELAGN